MSPPCDSSNEMVRLNPTPGLHMHMRGMASGSRHTCTSCYTDSRDLPMTFCNSLCCLLDVHPFLISLWSDEPRCIHLVHASGRIASGTYKLKCTLCARLCQARQSQISRQALAIRSTFALSSSARSRRGDAVALAGRACPPGIVTVPAAGGVHGVAGGCPGPTRGPVRVVCSARGGAQVQPLPAQLQG